MKKTIGGDRLGAGKKMQVDLKTYNRSTHDLGYLWKSSMASGTLVPFLKQVMLPGDTFDIDLECDIMTHPTVGPLFGSFKVQLDVFMCPIRLYNGKLHNNALGIGMKMDEIKLPKILLREQDDEEIQFSDQQTNASCILNYLGIKGVGAIPNGTIVNRPFNAVPYLAYWDIYKNYYANKQEEIGAVIHSNPQSIVKTVDEITYTLNSDPAITIPQYPIETGTVTHGQVGSKITITLTSNDPEPTLADIYLVTSNGTYPIGMMYATMQPIDATTLEFTDPIVAGVGFPTIKAWAYGDQINSKDVEPKITTFPLENIDTMRNEILANAINSTEFTINEETDAPYGLPLQYLNFDYSRTYSQEGLALKTYLSDQFNNWMSTEWIDGETGINAITAIDTSSGEFTIDTLNLANKVYNMLNRIAISGGSYDDWLSAVYSHERIRQSESPVYMGGLVKELVFQQVISNSASETSSGEQPLGQLGGRGVLSNHKKGGSITIKADEPAYAIGIVSLTPRLDYSQGNDWDVNLDTLNDLHKPALDEIGFQDLITEYMAAWSTSFGGSGIIQRSAGKQPAWINYMTNVNKTYGNFAIEDNEMFMTLNRRYERSDFSNAIKDMTTYIDPAKFNYIFAETKRDAQNFWVQIAVDLTARRKMSAKIMPNL